MAKNSFVIHHDLREKIEDLNNEQIGELFKAILDYEIDGTLPLFTDKELKIAFKFIKVGLDIDREKYQETCEKRKQNIQKRWDKKKYKHPTIKPMPLVRQHLLHATQPNDIIFDPFAGSGTTGVACQDIGRQFIGFEIEQKWVKVANDRLQKVDSNGKIGLFAL